MNTREIDIVYLWCDSTDERWRAKMLAAARRLGLGYSGEGKDEKCRFEAHDELRYSLRSVEMHAPWIRKVFIVVDDDASLPGWLDVGNSRLRIVRHSEIMPSEMLPCFNSIAMEHHLWKIEGLSERFLYANDDMFFANPCDPGFFFGSDGYPIIRFAGRFVRDSVEEASNLYHNCVANAQDAVKSRFGRFGGFEKAWRRLPHHNIDAYLRSDFRDCYRMFEADLIRTSRHAFRDRVEYMRNLYSDYALAIGHGHFRLARSGISGNRPWYKRLLRPGYADSLQFVGRGIHDAECAIAKWRPRLICFNGSNSYTEADYDLLIRLQNRLYPTASSYERGGTVQGGKLC